MSAPFASPTAAELAAALLQRRAAYAPDLRPREDGPAHALIEIAAEYLESLGERVGRMPDKHLAALLDMVGVSLLPAQPASATVVFTPLPGAAASRVTAGTRLGANLPGLPSPLPFETGEGVAITSSALAEVWTVLPGSDAAADHGPDLVAGAGTTLFAGARRVERQLLLGDPVRLALSGRAEILLDVTLRTAGSASLALEWAWWDGDAWQPFAPFAEPDAAGDDDSIDGTRGLTRSGRVRLVAPCAKAKPLTVEGIESCWIRARTTVALAPRHDLRAPEIAALRLRTILRRSPVRLTVEAAFPAGVYGFGADGAPLPAHTPVTLRTLSSDVPDVALELGEDGGSDFQPAAGTTFAYALGARPAEEDFLAPITIGAGLRRISLTRQRGLQPDKAIGDEKSLDVTRSFQPLGQSPTRGAAFYLACDEVFAKPGARVALSLARPRSASEEADDVEDEFRGTVRGAQSIIAKFKASLEGAATSLEALLSVADGAIGVALPKLVADGTSTFGWYSSAKTQVGTAIAQLVQALQDEASVFNSSDQATQRKALANAGYATGSALANLLKGQQATDVAAAAAALGRVAIGDLSATATLFNKLVSVAAASAPGGSTGFLTGSRPDYLLLDPEAFEAEVARRFTDAKKHIGSALTEIRSVVDSLAKLDVPGVILVATGQRPPELDVPQIAWEYWNGSRWRELAVTGDAEQAVQRFGASGTIRFTVPVGWEPCEVLNDARRWLRARLASGSFTHLRFVTWTDAKSGLLNLLPVVEPRPPVLDAIEVFFDYASPSAPPVNALSQNDLQWEDVTPRLALPGPGFAPFRAMPDRAPTLYLGFDGQLPADRLGLYVQLREPDPDARPLALTWEGFDGVAWRTLAADDGTRGLTAHGVVGLVWPGDASPPGAEVLGASGRSVALADRDAATRFAPGDRVLVRDPRGGEPGVVVAAAGETLTLRDEVSRPYVGGEVVDAPPARFGTPRTWLRARFDATAGAPEVALAKLLMNATDAWQRDSVTDELVGSSDGSPRQVVFVARPPILADEIVEVREIEGRRAAVDLPILQRELAAAGMPAAIAVGRDPRTREITEVWVRWSMRASLGLSGPADRHYAVDPSGGRILFGDGVHGRIPPATANNIRVTYRSGGGAAGNVAAGEISAIVSAIPASRMANPLPASGGADGEPLAAALDRGPALLRHRRVAITTADAADLARETCPAVARSRVLGARDAYGRPLPGHTRVIVIPDVDEPRPQPDAELRRRVRVALAVRAPATAAAGIVVIGPDYVPVGADVTVRAAVLAEPGLVRVIVLAELERFLHPLRGGPDEGGFAFGRSVFLSDLARALEALDGVDVVTAVALTRDGIEQGERVDVGPGQLVCAGALSVTLAGGGA